MLWGKSIWSTIHIVALSFPDSPTDADRDSYRIFYNALGKVLPCSKCQGNYARHMSEVSIDYYLFSKQMLFDWTVKLHNIVNAELGKPAWSYEQALAHYSSGAYAKTGASVGDDAVAASGSAFGSGILKNTNVWLLVANLMVFIVILICMVVTKKRKM